MSHDRQEPVDGTGGGKAPDPSRRRLLQAGAAASPVLLSMVSRPVHAGGTSSCVVASSFVSVATFQSRNGGSVTVSCGQHQCEWWQSQCSNLNSCSHTVKGCLTQTNYNCLRVPGSSQFSNQKCMELYGSSNQFGGFSNCGIQTSGEQGVLQHLAALANNCTAGYINNGGTPITTAYLQGVCNNYYSNGGRYIVPQAGINWSDTQLIGYLRAMLGYPLP